MTEADEDSYWRMNQIRKGTTRPVEFSKPRTNETKEIDGVSQSGFNLRLSIYSEEEGS